MKRTATLLLAAALFSTGTVQALADPIEGLWMRPSNGTLVRYAKQGDAFCGTVQSGEYEGQSIGCLKPSGNGYAGKVIALDEGKTYTGKATVAGNTLRLKGCVLVICKGEDWIRQ